MTDETQLATVEFRVEDAEGEVDVETLWAKPLGNGLYRLENSPFFAYDVSWEDIVEARQEVPDGFPVFRRVAEKSGNRSVRVLLDPPVDGDNVSQKILDQIVALGCSYEGANRSLITVNIPREADLWAVRKFLIAKGVQWEHADPSYDKLFPDAD